MRAPPRQIWRRAIDPRPNLIPVGWLIAVTVACDLAALYSIWHSPVHSRKAKGWWTTIVLVLPILGALGWVSLGRERRRPPS